VIAISALSLLFGGVVYFHSVYAAKSRALGAARAQAWLATVPGACDGESQIRTTAVAEVPQMFANGVANASLTVNAGSGMSCNIQPTELKSTLEVVQGIIGSIGDQF
jgi:hypothetical protein